MTTCPRTNTNDWFKLTSSLFQDIIHFLEGNHKICQVARHNAPNLGLVILWCEFDEVSSVSVHYDVDHDAVTLQACRDCVQQGMLHLKEVIIIK